MSRVVLVTLSLLKFDQEGTPEYLQQIPVVNFHRLECFRLRRMTGGEGLKFLNLLRDLREFNTSNLKDKVYAIVGLASDAEGFDVDYEPHQEPVAKLAKRSESQVWGQSRGSQAHRFQYDPRKRYSHRPATLT